MNDFIYLSLSMMAKCMKVLDGGELKMLYGILYCLCCSDKEVFINNDANRQFIREFGFDKSSIRMSNLLYSLTKKGILIKEGHGVYSVVDGLYLKRGEN